jgi:SAM-dependent methyltransferase
LASIWQVVFLLDPILVSDDLPLKMPNPKMSVLCLFLLLISPFARASQPDEEVQIHAPYVETSPGTVDAMLKLAHTKRKDVVYDLGCGDGRIVIAAAKEYGSRGVGIDINPERVRQAQVNARREGVESLVTFRVGDVYDADVRNATVVMLYLLPEMNLKLRPKLRGELRPGARIVTHDFAMGDWRPKKQKDIDGDHIYLWVLHRRFWLF